MQKRVLASLLLLGAAIACGASSSQKRVDEVPIDQNIKRPTDLPPDEVGSGSASSSTTSASLPEHGPPPGVGPQPLDGPDSGATASGGDAGPTNMAAFVARPGGPSQKECTDVVLKLATLTTKESRSAAVAAADLPQHPIYGQMLTECSKTTTKKQQKCGMGARSSIAWKKCME